MRCNESITLLLGEGGNCQHRNDDLNTLFHEREITRKQWKGRKKKLSSILAVEVTMHIHLNYKDR